MLAKLVIGRVPSIEMVRFVNSGTEACLSVLRLMRAYTKRDKVIAWHRQKNGVCQDCFLDICLMHSNTKPEGACFVAFI